MTEADRTMYYMQDLRGAVGNCASWWAKEDQGYTCDINEAKVWTEEEAREQHEMRSTDMPYPVDAVRRHIVSHVRVEPLYRMRREPLLSSQTHDPAGGDA